MLVHNGSRFRGHRRWQPATSSATAAPAKADREPMPCQKRLAPLFVLIPGISWVAAGGWWHLFGWCVFPVDHAASAGGWWYLFGCYVFPVDHAASASPRCPENQPQHHADGADDHQDVANRGDRDAIDGGGDAEPEDGSHHDQG